MTGKPYRLPQEKCAGRVIDRSKPLSFTFDGKKMSGFAGDTLASAVMANGQRVMGRSFKYHRPRGLLTLGSEEPNALVGVGEGSRAEPDLRASQVELYDGMVAVSQNRWPSLDFDVGIVNNFTSRLFPSGFYYKTFMWPKSFWHKVYEPIVRFAAGLGVAPKEHDPDVYEQVHVHCDVLIIGAGVAGLAAAQAACATGKRVIIADENPRLGGTADISGGEINGKSQLDWAAERAVQFARAENVQVLVNTTVTGHYHHNYLMMSERLADHDPELAKAGVPRHRLWKVRAGKVIVAAGANERPLTFANNDRPGVMLSSSVRALAHRYGVAPGLCGVVFTNNDDAYLTALALKKCGVGLNKIIDVRTDPQSEVISAARDAGIDIMTGHAIAGVETGAGGKQIEAVKVAPYVKGRGRVVNETSVVADFVAVSGGWNPAVHLWCHNGGRVAYDDKLACFRPSSHNDEIDIIGTANGTMDLKDCLNEAYDVGEAAGGKGKYVRAKAVASKQADIEALWFSPATGKYNEGNKHFIDLQNDVTAADLELAQREGYTSVEHTKRYTTLGMATDQGKSSNVTGLGIMAEANGKTVPEMGTTTFRPPYTSISFGAIAGTQRGELFHVVRRTSVYDWHIKNTKILEPIADWRRPYCYPKPGESKHDAINREILSVRNSVGVLDASTLGKIEIKGPDAGEFLNRMYTNAFAKLAVGKCRYGLMMNEMGFLMDDGVTAKLAEDHYLMHTTSGGAERIAAWLEEWLQTEWFDLKVFVTPVTEQWAQFAIAGPKARAVLEKLGGEIDISPEGLPFMGMRVGKIGGFDVRLFRISFSGELSFEIATRANHGQALWDAIFEAGKEFGIEPYGTEALHVLRAEKGFIAIGDETDGTVTPLDLDLAWAVSKKKPDYLGKRSLEQEFLKQSGRKQLVGLSTDDPKEVLPDGAPAVDQVKEHGRMKTIGHVTSSYWSPTLDRSIAMALIEDGSNRMGEKISFPLADKVIVAEIVSPVFYDKEGTRQNV